MRSSSSNASNSAINNTSSRASSLLVSGLPCPLPPRRPIDSFDTPLEWAWESFAEFKPRLSGSQTYTVDTDLSNLIHITDMHVQGPCIIWFSDLMLNSQWRQECARELRALMTEHMRHLAHQQAQLNFIRTNHEKREMQHKRKCDAAIVNRLTID